MASINPPTFRSIGDLASTCKPRSKTTRRIRESLIMFALILCGLFTLSITVSILLILSFETYEFFAEPHLNAQQVLTDVSAKEFFTGLEWSPLLGDEKKFGIWPLIAGTAKIVVVAMTFALPVGLMVAIWLSEYASPRARGIIKPVLEVLAGVPTVVFGFFALILLTPVLRYIFNTLWGGALEGTFLQGSMLDVRFENYNGLSAGLAVGVMTLPIVTSLSEDALRAVPRLLREGSYGLGATRFETSVRVIVPAALSGIVAAFLLAVARAVGETMIVALAAGQTTVQLTKDGSFNPSGVFTLTDPLQPMTGYMVQIFLGDVPHGTVEYYSSYAVAMTLFVITLLLTLVGGLIRDRFRQVYN